MPDRPPFRWSAGSSAMGTATGLGPFPGTDPREAARVIFTQLRTLPYLPVLPARGPGSDPIGRTAAFLVDLHVDLEPSGWRLVPNPGIDERRARSALANDLDALEEAAETYEGDVKVQLVGPATLAGSLALPGGEKAVVDPGAVRDLAGSLAEGLSRHIAEIRRRLPAVGRIVVALDEPLLPAVLSGNLPTASGWGRLRAVDIPEVKDLLSGVITAGGPDTGVVCSVPEPPIELLQDSGARFLGIAADLLGAIPEDDLGFAVDAGFGLVVGLVPADATDHRPDDLAEPVRRVWGRLGFPWKRLPETVAVTHLDGLEHLTGAEAAKALHRTDETGRHLEELAEQD